MMEHYIIELPQGVVNILKRRRLKKRLNEKLNEYQERCTHSKNRRERLDAWHKTHILSILLQRSRVEKTTLAKKMQILPEFEWLLFERAWDVIYAYVNNAQDFLPKNTDPL